jgi:hypothetical protein
MPALSKEGLPVSGDAELFASQEVDGYIERIEKQAENKQSDSNATQPTANVSPSTTVTDDMGKIVMAQFQNQSNGPITIPFDEEGLKKGLAAKVAEGIRWLAEWSLYMIRKYPGRVYFKNKND